MASSATEHGGGPGRRGLRQAATAVGFAALLASFVLGTNLLGARDALFGDPTPPPRASAFSRVAVSAPASSQKSVLRSQPWWQRVAGFNGTGSREIPANIGAGAIQWRMRWSCTSGHLTVRAPGGSAPLIDAGCPARSTTEVVARPDGPLAVTAAGRWQMVIERQVDVPLVEPPLPAMSAPGARRVSSGAFYRIDQVGKGRVTIYRLAGGRHALRLEDFYVTPNVDLEIRLSPLRRPRTTRQYHRTRSVLVHPLDVTTGAMNFMLPAGVDPARYRSIVLWCENLFSAYAGASLRPAR